MSEKQRANSAEIQEQVLELATGFRGYWTAVFENSPRYVLDYSWPSLATVDLILRASLNRRFPEEQEADKRAQQVAKLTALREIQFRGAACYLGVMAAGLFENYADSPEVALAFSTDNDALILTISGGLNLKSQEKFTLDVLAALKASYLELAGGEAYFNGLKRALSPDSKPLVLLAQGIFSGLSPRAEGPWKEKSIEQLEGNAIGANLLLSASTAEYYTRCFPSEPLGKKEELYFSCLVMPPLGFRERDLGVRATKGFCLFLKAQTEKENECLACALNLASTGMEGLVVPGLAVALALSPRVPALRLQHICESYSFLKWQLRDAIMIAREQLKEIALSEWNIVAKSGEAVRDFLELDSSLGFFPLLKLSLSDFWNELDLRFVLYYLINFELPQARQALSEYVLQKGGRINLLLQLAHLELYLNNNSQAEEILTAVDDDKASARGYLPLKRELESYVALNQGRFSLVEEKLKDLFERGLEPFPQSELLRNIWAESVLALGRVEEAAQIFGTLKSRLENPSLRTVCNLARVFPEDELVQEALNVALRHVPYYQLLAEIKYGLAKPY